MITDLEVINFAKKRIRNECDYILKKDGKITRDTILGETQKEFQNKLGNFSNIESLITETADFFVDIYKIKIGEVLGLSDDENHLPWLNNKNLKRSQVHWEIYKEYLKDEEGFPEPAIVDIDKSTEVILDKLEDPKRPGSWDRRGVVIGSVQSGKTANFIGLINKARDAGDGYKFIVILSGANNDLRQQTQERIDDGYVGVYTSEYSKIGQHGATYTPLGLLRHGKHEGDFQWPLNGTYNDIKGDFNNRAFEGLPKQNINADDNTSYVFVCKKNKTPLTKLIQWICKHPQAKNGGNGFENMKETNKTEPPYITTFPLLLLDDECDHYSVDTNKKPKKEDGTFDEEYDPKTINGLIRKLLMCFSKKCYVGYTATPFANIFISDQAKAKNYGPDLFPKSFMFDIRPPSNHQGLESLFSSYDDDEEGSEEPSNFIIPIKDFCNDFKDLNCDTGWMPYKHNKHHIPEYDQNNGFVDENILDDRTLNFYIALRDFSKNNKNKKIDFPPSLIHSVMSFIIASAVRNVRSFEQIGQHKSMLIHVSKFINVQERIEEQLHLLIQTILDIIKYKKSYFYECLKEIYETYFLEYTKEFNDSTRPNISFEDLEHNEKGIKWIINEIKKNIYRMSGQNGNKPNYRQYKRDFKVGLTTIIIGGDKLSRGVTFNGLSTSYFLRSSKMYDTLMQMGRWFGYRIGYDDLCRLYTSPELKQNFININIASEELRARVKYMQEQGRTPKDFGLAVKTSPGLMITSKLKMQDGKIINPNITRTSRQTTTNTWEENKILSNYETTDKFLKNLGKEQEGPIIKRDRGTLKTPNGPVKIDHKFNNTYCWENIHYSKIKDFLSKFYEHESSQFNAHHITKYIEFCVNKKYLTSWNVILAGDGNSNIEMNLGGKKINLIERLPTDDSSEIEKKASFGAIWDPRHEFLDLNKKAYQDSWLEAQRHLLKDSRIEATRFAQSMRRKRDKEKGIILLYPIVPIIYKTVNQEKELSNIKKFKDKWENYKKNFIRKGKLNEDCKRRKAIICLGLSLPELEDVIAPAYVGNNKYWEEEQYEI